MSFESPDMAKEFPGLYGIHAIGEELEFEGEEKLVRKKELARRRDSKPERRGKGYRMFEEEDSEEELVVADDTVKSPTKMKKHSKPSFKFPKRDKLYKPKEKDKDRDRDLHHHHHREKWGGEKDRGDGLGHKEGKKKEDKLKWRKRKLLGQGINVNTGASAVKTETNAAPEPEIKPVFAVPLNVAVDRSKSHDGIQLPLIIRECIDYIEEFGLACEGIYRISGVKSKVQALKDSYNQNKPVFLGEHEPNIIASLLKLFLREIPEPVLTKELMPKFEEASTVKNVKQKVEFFQQLIEQLPVPNKLLLSWMIVHMTHVISKEKQNKMSLQNVSIVLSPTMQISHRVLNVLFTYSRILFKDTVIKKHVPPLKPVSSHWSLDLPESPSALEEELHKQESLLNELHEQVMKVKDSDKEEQLWEVQRVVTQLKRKIKNMKKASEVHEEIEQLPRAPERHPPVQPPRTLAIQTPEMKARHAASAKVAEKVVKQKVDTEKTERADSVPIEEDLDQEVKLEESDTKESDETPTETSETIESVAANAKTVPTEQVDMDQEVVSATAAANIIAETDSSDPALEQQDKEATPEVESPEPSSDTLEMELDGEDEENQSLEPLPEDDHEPRPNNIHIEEHFSKGVQLEDGQSLGSAGDDNLETPVFVKPPLSASSQEGSLASREIYESNKIVSSDTSDGQASPSAVSMDEADDDALQEQYNELLLEEEELYAMGDELRKKIETEKSEMERLDQEIVELRDIREDLYDSDDISSDSSYEEEDEEELKEILRQLQLENEELENETLDLSAKVQVERQICLNVKVQIRMIQQRQLESSGGMLLMDGISESDALIDSLL